MLRRCLKPVLQSLLRAKLAGHVKQARKLGDDTRILQISSPKTFMTDSFAASPCLQERLRWHRCYATTSSSAEGDAPKSDNLKKEDAEEVSASTHDDRPADEGQPAANLSPEELQAEMEQSRAALDKLSAEYEDFKDQAKRALAETNNSMQRVKKSSETAVKFAVQGFVKDLLDVADNLERAASVVPAETVEGKTREGAPLTTEQALAALRGLLEGVQMTEKIMLQAFERHKVEKFTGLGDKFDPNLHQALFEIPDPSAEPGTVGIVTKPGFKLEGRVIRPAMVGVVKAS